MEWITKFKRLPYFFQLIYERVTASIAFYPILITLAFFLLTGLMFYAESHGLTAWLGQRFPTFLLLKSWDVAQSILTTLVGALISLMVFSFSMVMVLLNNAASNFSPRILPSLVANKFHQFVLGTYLGSIVFCLLTVLNMTPNQDQFPLPGFSVLLGILFGVFCLLLFVFFIHSISESVQVGKILESLHFTTMKNLKKGTVSQLSDHKVPSNFGTWKTYPADRSGYLKSVNIKSISAICAEENLKLKALIPESKFVLAGADMFACDKIIDEDLQKKILANFVLSISEVANDDHIIGFKQITEIALKAMSPGINDPGTALSAIDYLTILFMEKMKLPETGAVIYKNEDGEEMPNRFWLSIVSFDDLLTYILAPLRQYVKHDFMVMMKLLEMLKFLTSRQHCKAEHLAVLQREVNILRVDAEKNLTNPSDYNRVLTFIESFPNTKIIN